MLCASFIYLWHWCNMAAAMGPTLGIQCNLTFVFVFISMLNFDRPGPREPFRTQLVQSVGHGDYTITLVLTYQVQAPLRKTMR